MNANELRIGNLLSVNWKNDPVIVTGEIIHEVENYEHEYQPIPITEEWLIRFGFKYDEDDKWYVLDSIIAVSFNSIFNGLTHYFGNLECVWADVSQEIKYVHQLQNLYFALTGDEL